MKYSLRKAMLALDALSRTYIKNSKPDFDEKSLIRHVHFVISNLPISKKHLGNPKRCSFGNPYKVHYWRLARKTLILHELHLFFTQRSDISYHEVLLLKRSWNYCPQCSKILNKVHIKGHLGIESCKKRAHQTLF